MNAQGDQGDSQRKNELELEMSRFEQEISEHPAPSRPPIISANTFRLASQAIQQAVPPALVQTPAPVQSRPPPRRLPPPPMPPRVPLLHGPPPGGPIPAMGTGIMQGVPGMPLASQSVPRVMPQVAMPMVPMSMTVPPQMGPASTSAPPQGAITAEEKKEWESTYAQSEGGGKERKKGKDKKFLRVAGGQLWEDNSLSEWDSDDFRIFCGDLGNEVTDDQLTRAFAKYPSFLRAKVVRDKKTSKSKGYGFVSFKDPNDFIRAMREMNGKYVGNRPIKLRKSTWKDRSVEVVRKKVKEKKRLGLR